MMKVTRSQTIFLSVLGVSVAALVVDRYQDTKPAQIQAIGPLQQAVTMSEEHSAIPPSDAHDFPKSMQISGSDADNPRDIFVIPADFDNSDSDFATMTERVRQFHSAHSLKAVIDRGGHGTAIIDESLLKVGDSLDGFRLQTIDRSRAIFVDGQTRLELQLVKPDGSI